ncbi:MAG: peptidylprolyl isomerase, partial [Flavobacteriaceae bacterium CG_4_9_14_3_um_filter_33_16]
MRFLKDIPIVFLFGFLLLVFSCQNKYPELGEGIYAEFITSKGIMLAKLHYQKTPYTVANFISLADGTNKLVDSIYRGKKF